MALAREGQQVTTPRSVLKDPLVLEFLDLAERPQWRERDLEQAIIDQLETFLLELGKGFCFVARQKRITLDGDHFFVDLVFYNRLLRCFVLVDLKLGKLTHQDLGQMQMYVNLYDETERAADEESTVGIVLCSGLSTDGLADPRHGKLRLAFELPGDCFGGFEILFPAALTSVPSVTSAAELHVFATGLLLSVASSHAVIAVAAH